LQIDHRQQKRQKHNNHDPAGDAGVFSIVGMALFRYSYIMIGDRPSLSSFPIASSGGSQPRLSSVAGETPIAGFMVAAVPILTAAVGLIPSAVGKTIDIIGEALDEAIKDAVKSFDSAMR